MINYVESTLYHHKKQLPSVIISHNVSERYNIYTVQCIND